MKAGGIGAKNFALTNNLTIKDVKEIGYNTAKRENIYGVSYNQGVNVTGSDNGISHFIVKPGDAKVIYNVYEGGEYIGQYETYVRNDEVIEMWYYKN